MVATPRKTKPVKCIVEGCTEEARARGMCPKCYRSAARDVAAGKTTWEELEKAGIALPLGANMSLVRKQLEKRRKSVARSSIGPRPRKGKKDMERGGATVGAS